MDNLPVVDRWDLNPQFVGLMTITSRAVLSILSRQTAVYVLRE